MNILYRAFHRANPVTGAVFYALCKYAVSIFNLMTLENFSRTLAHHVGINLAHTRESEQQRRRSPRDGISGREAAQVQPGAYKFNHGGNPFAVARMEDSVAVQDAFTVVPVA